MYPDLYLMRHGQTQWNAAGRLQGVLDSPLTAQGIAEAERQRDLAAGIVAARHASPQGRAQATARIVFGDAPFASDPRLSEIDIGGFAGETYQALRARLPALFAGGSMDWYDRVPGGEGFDRLAARCRGFLDSLAGPALVVTHGVTLRMLAVLALGQPVSHMERIPVRQGEILVIRAGRHDIRR